MNNETITEKFTMKVQPINNTTNRVMFNGSPWNRDYKNNNTLGTIIGPRVPRIPLGNRNQSLGKALNVIA